MKCSIRSGELLLGSWCLTLASCSGGSSSLPPLGWVPTFGPGSSLDARVRALTVFDEGAGAGPALYAGGDFIHAGKQEVNRIARWNGSTWSALGTGLNEEVRALTTFDDGSGGGSELHAGGFFSHAGGVEVNGIARWDGNNWSALGGGVDNLVLALTVFDDGSGSGRELYAGGSFTAAGGVTASNIAKWNGSDWAALGSGTNATVIALTVFDDGSGGGPELYAGGSFTIAGGVNAYYVAKWNGSTWSALGDGMNEDVLALSVFDDGSGGGPALYAGGVFTHAGGVEVNSIAKWDGSTWSALGSGISDALVHALRVFDDGSGGGPALYAGGLFTHAGELEVNRIAKWDGSTWSPLGAGLSGSSVFALAVFDDGSSSGGVPHGPSLFVGGSFDTSPAGDSFLAKWGRSHGAVLSGPEGSQQLTSLHPGASELEDGLCALTARIGTGLRLDDSELYLLLEHAHVAPLRNVQWLAGTIELRGGCWRQTEPLVLGVAGPARLVLAEGARLEIPRVIVGPQGELMGEGLLLGDLENQGLVAPSGSGFELRGRYSESPPGTLSDELGSRARARYTRPAPSAR